MVRLACLGGLFMTFIACTDDPCTQYADYMCVCHDDDPAIDCGELQLTYAADDPDVWDQCAIDLAEQKAVDQASGLECVIEEEPF